MVTIGNEDTALSLVAYEIFKQFIFKNSHKNSIFYTMYFRDIIKSLKHLDSEYLIFEVENALYELKLNGNITSYEISKNKIFFSFTCL